MTWKILLGLAHLIFDLALIWMLFGRPGKRGSAKVRGAGQIEFAPDWIGLWAYPLTIAYSVWLAARALLHSHAKLSDLLTPAVFGAIALSLFISFPGKVVVTADGLEEIHRLGRSKRIRWRDIEQIESSGKDILFSTITITGMDGTKIVHSDQLADRPRLLLEIRRHCGEELPPDFPGV